MFSFVKNILKNVRKKNEIDLICIRLTHFLVTAHMGHIPHNSTALVHGGKEENPLRATILKFDW